MKEYGLKEIYFHDIYDNEGLQITEETVNYKVLD